MPARCREHEAAIAAGRHRLERGIAERIERRRIDEHHVVADAAHAGAVEAIEDLGMALPRPWPAAFAEAAVVVDRAVVDLDDDGPAGGFRLDRTIIIK